MSARSIVVEGEEFSWKVGRLHVSIRRASDRKGWHPACHEVLGITADEFERGRRKGTAYGAVTPSSVAGWLRDNVLYSSPGNATDASGSVAGHRK